ncbi:hypothetical protein Esti_006431 [Eimeria stiedai]
MKGLSVLLLFVFMLLLAFGSAGAAAASRVRGLLLLDSLQQGQNDAALGAFSPLSHAAAKEDDVEGSLLESGSPLAAEERFDKASIPKEPSAADAASRAFTRAAPLSLHQDLLPDSSPQLDSSSTARPVDASESPVSSTGEADLHISEAFAEDGVAEALRGQQLVPLTCDDQPCGEGQMTCKAITKGRFSCTCKSGYALLRDGYAQPMCVKVDSAGSMNSTINELFSGENSNFNNKWAVGWSVFGLLVGGALLAAFVWAAVVIYERSKSTESRGVQEEFTSLLTDKKSSVHSILTNPHLRSQEVEQSGEEEEQQQTPTEGTKLSKKPLLPFTLLRVLGEELVPLVHEARLLLIADATQKHQVVESKACNVIGGGFAPLLIQKPLDDDRKDGSRVPPRQSSSSCLFVLTLVMIIIPLGEVDGLGEKSSYRRRHSASFLGPAAAPRDQGVFAPHAFPSANFLEIREGPQTPFGGEQLTTGLPPVATPPPTPPRPPPPPAASQQSNQQTAPAPPPANSLPPAAAPSLTAGASSGVSLAAPQQQPLNAVPPDPSSAATNSKPSVVPVAFRAAAAAPGSPQASSVSSAASVEPRVIVQRAPTPAAASQQAPAPLQAAAGSSGAPALSRCYPCVDAAQLGASSSCLSQELLAAARGQVGKSESHVAWIVLLGVTIVCLFLLAVGVLWVASAYISQNLERPNKQAAAQAAASAAPSRNRQRADFDFNARSLRSPSRHFETQPQAPRPYSSSPSLSIRAHSSPGGALNA